MKNTNKISINRADLRNMISEATRAIIKEYWTSADDAAAEAHRQAEERVEKEFQDILKSDSRYITQAKRLASSFEYFMKAFEQEKEKLAERFHGEARVQSTSSFKPFDFEIFVRDVDANVMGGMENIDVAGGHRLNYRGNDYENGTLDFNRQASLELTVRFSLAVVNRYEEHQINPNKSWWEDAEGNPVNGGTPGARRIPDYNPEWEKDHEGENDWVSPDEKWRHKVSKGYIKTNRDVYNDKEKGYDEDTIAAYESLAVRNLARLGRSHNWVISFDDRGSFGDDNVYKVKFYA